MGICKLGHLFLIISILSSTIAQNNQNDLFQTTNALNTFGLNLLTETIDASGNSLNLALAPYTIWSLLSILAEGANGKTAQELNSALQLPENKDMFRKSYRYLKSQLSQESDGVSLEISNAIFTPNDQIIRKNFEQITRKLYGVDILPMDINNIPKAVRTINSYMAAATKNKIPNFVSENDLVDAEMFLTSAIFFKGRWSVPFNKTYTTRDNFYDENNRKIGTVDMMYLLAPFAYSVIHDIKAVAIEIPYGTGDKMSMIVLLPFKGEKLANVIRKLSTFSITKIIEELENSIDQFPDANVHLYLPRFKIESDFILNGVLDKMGIKSLFNAQEADLLNLSTNYLYVSRMMQRSLIEVDEEGTVATAASGAFLEDRITPPKFYANKPFAYLIVEKKTRSILFAGTVSNPNGI